MNTIVTRRDVENEVALEALRGVRCADNLKRNTKRGREGRDYIHKAIALYASFTLVKDPNEYGTRGFTLGLITAVMLAEAGKGSAS